MQFSGKVVFWRDDKGFGFVLCQQNQQKIFFHIRDFAGTTGRPEQGDELHFAIKQDKQGRDIAAPWCFSSAKTNNSKPLAAQGSIDIHYAQQISLFFRVAFLITVLAALLFGRLPFVLPLLYLEASIFTYWLYKADKDAAIAGHGNRLAEQSLHLFALIGGWPGAYLAQRQLAHKRSKLSFRREFGFVIIGNALLVSWLLSPWGQAFLARMALLVG
uniref:Membrane protein n=1 Tax=Rheinheimera sp. BAL341 TaxID=1708203 RepID=A0A486XNM4_9GAMM